MQLFFILGSFYTFVHWIDWYMNERVKLSKIVRSSGGSPKKILDFQIVKRVYVNRMWEVYYYAATQETTIPVAQVESGKLRLFRHFRKQFNPEKPQK